MHITPEISKAWIATNDYDDWNKQESSYEDAEEEETYDYNDSYGGWDNYINEKKNKNGDKAKKFTNKGGRRVKLNKNHKYLRLDNYVSNAERNSLHDLLQHETDGNGTGRNLGDVKSTAPNYVCVKEQCVQVSYFVEYVYLNCIA